MLTHYLASLAPELPSKKVLFQKELYIAVTNNFVYSVGCLFTKLAGCFTVKRYFIFIKHHMSIIDFISWVMGIKVRKYFPVHIYYSVLLQQKKKEPLAFVSRSFRFILGYLIHSAINIFTNRHPFFSPLFLGNVAFLFLKVFVFLAEIENL